jgi:hypothetical protein
MRDDYQAQRAEQPVDQQVSHAAIMRLSSLFVKTVGQLFKLRADFIGASWTGGSVRRGRLKNRPAGSNPNVT